MSLWFQFEMLNKLNSNIIYGKYHSLYQYTCLRKCTSNSDFKTSVKMQLPNIVKYLPRKIKTAYSIKQNVYFFEIKVIYLKIDFFCFFYVIRKIDDILYAKFRLLLLSTNS